MAFSYYRPITIDHSQVPSNQTDFPVLVNYTNLTLANAMNGGHVQNTSGFDLAFYSDLGITRLKWEIERYNSTTGEVVAWIKIPTVSNTLNTSFYMFYGDATISADISDPVNVWTNGFLGVYHLKNGTTLSVADSTGLNNGTNNGVTATAGQIDGGGSFVSANSQYIALPASINPKSYSAWINAASFPNALNMIIGKNGGSGVAVFYVNNSAKLIYENASSQAAGVTTLSTSTWYYVSSLEADGVNGTQVFINGVSDATGSNNAGAVGTDLTQIGSDQAGGGRYFNGLIDEPRISSVRRASDWFVCEYANQKTNSTFVTVGGEVPIGLTSFGSHYADRPISF